MQPLHDEQHSGAGAGSVGVIDHRSVQVHQPLVFRQSPERERERDSADPHTFDHIQEDTHTFWHLCAQMCPDLQHAAGGNSPTTGRLPKKRFALVQMHTSHSGRTRRRSRCVRVGREKQACAGLLPAQRRRRLTWCNETPKPGRSSVCRQAVTPTLRRRDYGLPSCRTGTRPRTGPCPALGRASAFLSKKKPKKNKKQNRREGVIWFPATVRERSSSWV